MYARFSTIFSQFQFINSLTILFFCERVAFNRLKYEQISHETQFFFEGMDLTYLVDMNPWRKNISLSKKCNDYRETGANIWVTNAIFIQRLV